MDIYMYRGALYCGDCGEDIRESLTVDGEAPQDPEDELSYDSETFPKGPFDSNDESDSPQSCDKCGIFLENRLTEEGIDHLHWMIIDSLHHGRVSAACRDWIEYYQVELEDLINNL